MARTATNPDTGERVQWNEETRKWEPITGDEETPPPGFQREGGSWMHPLAQGLTLGYADEIAAGLAAIPAWAGHDIPYGEAYRGIRGKIRGETEAFAERNPMLSTGLEIAGALPTAMASGARLIGASPSLLRGGAVGAGESAVAAFGAGEGDPVSQALGAIPAAALGGALGAGGQAVANILPGLLPKTTMPQRALETGFEADALTPAILRSRARQMGPEATLADVGGEGMLTVAQAVAGTSPKTRALARTGLSARGTGQTGRLLDAFEESTGIRPNWGLADETIDEIAVARSAEAAPLWDAARAHEISLTPTLKNALDQDIVKDAWRRAQSAARLEGRELPELYKYTDDGDLVSTGVVPDMDAWMEIKEYIDDAIRGNPDFVNPLTERQTKLGTKMFNFRDRLVDELDDITGGDYRKARDAWAGKTAIMEAVEEGRKILRADVSSVRRLAKRMSDSEKQGYLTGAAEAIREKMGRAGPEQMREFSFMDQPNFQEKLRALLPEGRKGDADLERLLRRLKTERRFKEAAQMVTRGAQTYPRAAAEKAFERNVPLFSDIQEGGVVGGTMNALNRFLKNEFGAVPPEVKERVAELMFQPGGTEAAIEYLQTQGLAGPVLRNITQGARLLPMSIGAAGQVVSEQ